MLSYKVKESLECALSTHLTHISVNPIGLSCGHTVCQDCISQGSQTNVTCVHCKKTQNVQVNQEESVPAKVLFDVFIDNMFDYVEDKFKSSLISLKESCYEANLKVRIEFLKEDINVRVESLKSELDLLKINLFNELEKIESEIKKNKLKDISSFKTLKEFEQDLNEQIKNKTKKEYRTLENFKKFQQNLQDLYHANELLHKNDFQLSFEPSNFAMNENSIGKINYSLNWDIDSKIINDEEVANFKNLCGFDKKRRFLLLYRGSRDGFEAQKFHSKCDGFLPTVTIIQTNNGFIFGGYTQAKWSSNGETIDDPFSFLFSFKNSMNTQFKSRVGSSNAILCYPECGPIFGGGSYYKVCLDNLTKRINKRRVCNYRNYDYPSTDDEFQYDSDNTMWDSDYNNDNNCDNDIFIADKSNTNNYSRSAFPSSYSLPKRGCYNYSLSGDYSCFTVTEIEVFHLKV